ncbi:hypothetical protein PROSTU_02021 [Providencia stuartii ATCC 25827]|uniref:Uncharacterized protein n=1 Tax=Providencia stuartii ATCC 25827 TaxID=471874 RepID=A0AA86YI71_PROST|nr:hypothetical protein PROSTU_02021 [Providencia stuartii ATCC 25827]
MSVLSSHQMPSYHQMTTYLLGQIVIWDQAARYAIKLQLR